MKVLIGSCILLLTGILAMHSPALAAREVYKWVTPDGITHFSETPPEAELASVEVIEMQPAPSPQTAPRSVESILDVAQSIEAGRLERERLRLEKRQQQAQRAAQDSARYTEPDEPAAVFYYPPYYRYPGLPRRHDFDRKPPRKPFSPRRPGEDRRAPHNDDPLGSLRHLDP